MRTEVNPRVKGAVYDDYIRGNLGSIVPNITGLTNVVTPDYLAKYQNVKESVSSPYQDRFTERFKEDPMSPRQVKRVGMDWLMNYKGMSRKEAREYLKSTENKQMGGKVRKAQSYLNVRPSSMMPLNQSVTQPVYSSIPNPSLSGRTAINIFQDKQNETEKELGKATKTAEDFMLNWSLSPMHNQMAKESHKNWKENFGSDHESKLNYLNRLRNLKNAITNDFLWHASSNLGERTQGEHESDSRIPERSLIRIKKGLNDAEKESVAIHELSHATDVRDGILPWDVYKMKDFSSDYASQFPEKKSYTAEEESSRNYRNYVADPTETRARLNNIRFDAKKAGIYDPFTEKLDEDKFQKLMKFYLNNPDRENTPLYELMDAYDLDQIFNMLNSISKNDPKKGDVSQAKGGMEIIADDGKDIVMPFDGPYASAPDGYEGLGYSSEGYNYNPAWGGRWQAGGVVENSEGIRYEHEPGSSGGLSNWNPVRTDAPDTTRRGIKKYTQAPASGKDVDFITNYANFRKAWRGEPEDYNPSTVPYEGDKHWNVKRFLLDTHLDDYYPDLNSFNSSLKERKKDVLTDMYKYYLLQNPEDRKGAWRQANKFMRQEVNPLVRGSFYKKYLSRPEDGKYSLYNSNAIAPSVDWANSNRLSYLHQERNSPMESDLEAMKQGKRFYTDRQMKRMSMDYFKNYRKMSRKDARQLWNQWEEQVKAEDEEWFREYQGGGMLPGMGGTMYARTGQDWKPKNISQDGSEIEGEEVIEDDMGQWAHPGEVTKINSNEITMEGVPYPVLGVSDTGDAKVMMPGEENIEFEGTSVTEYPLDGEEQNQPKPKTELEKVLESTSKYDKGATFKSLVGEVAKSSNISASWLFGSAFTEGMNIAALNPKMVSEGYLKAIENGVSFKGYPVDGFYNYGLDRFAENFKEFVKKGYLPSDFDFKPYKAMNELGEVVNTAAFKNNKDALKAKAAFLKHERDNIRKVAKNLGVKLSPEEEQFFAMASYNSPLGAQNMLKEIAKEKINPTSYILDKTRKRGQVYKNIMPRYRMMMALAGQFAFGGTIQDRGQLKKLDQLTNFTNYNRYD